MFILFYFYYFIDNLLLVLWDIYLFVIARQLSGSRFAQKININVFLFSLISFMCNFCCLLSYHKKTINNILTMSNSIWLLNKYDRTIVFFMCSKFFVCILFCLFGLTCISIIGISSCCHIILLSYIYIITYLECSVCRNIRSDSTIHLIV